MEVANRANAELKLKPIMIAEPKTYLNQSQFTEVLIDAIMRVTWMK
jgi:hypothetical protein